MGSFLKKEIPITTKFEATIYKEDPKTDGRPFSPPPEQN